MTDKVIALVIMFVKIQVFRVPGIIGNAFCIYVKKLIADCARWKWL
ncbi:MAG: hypothetical protein JWP81_2843 [Ferruginibacter sp.]|nr:hypothetical protein [Ferruginibacter sp.]